ncbi:Gfo/Idh/MocA family oxidoreductase [Octadecabacter sp. G9-8]|uniref:Gfo/Idh/MocA family oxidoreductase n=1 Tax=Octadecabacter dasysiphoniae TaxID=2909341 RepID=A0ABS9CX86_9RHOB|nr:Gfo/Idh/MocA family oxidoreductase [Octadecabacter dasysiphoniae]MCF2870663.1 Gfo/Idh/MocA family oxidoreductase [Octadecabacter dasysiphoniae]
MKIVTAGIGLRAAHVLSILKDAMPEAEIVGYYDPLPDSALHVGGQTISDDAAKALIPDQTYPQFPDAPKIAQLREGFAACAQLRKDTQRFNDLSDMLAQTDADLLFVGSPNSFHLEHIKIGLAAGVRIFTEKPVVTTKEDTMELTALLAEHGTDRVMVGLVLRYSQHMVDLRAVLDDLGPIVSLEANEHIAPYHGAFFMRDWRRMVSWSGGFMLEKCCHDIDIYNMVTGSRPTRVASFGGRKSFVPENAPTANIENEIMHYKPSVWNTADDAFHSDGDIIDHQTAILHYDSGASLAFHTNLNTPDEHRRFCIMGTHGMAEGDFVRGNLKATARDGTIIADHDYTKMEATRASAHYGADHMMVDDIVGFLKGQTDSLPVGVVDALEAGLVAMALDEARIAGTMVDLTATWADFDTYGLRQ